MSDILDFMTQETVLELILAAWCIHCSVPIVTYSFTVLPTSITSIIRLLPSTFSPFIRDKINTFTSIQSTWMPSLDVSAIASPSTFNESNTSATVQSRTESLSTLHRLYEVGQNSINVGVALFVLGFAVMCLAAYFVELARAMRTDMQWAILEASAKRSSDAKALTDALLQPALQVASPREATTLFFADSESDDAETYVGSEPSTPFVLRFSKQMDSPSTLFV
ncbi:hypothetical protein BC829DRAFT_439711 [Chytridium lagenaria]|nr:hypothetical protein BC829DRAFT_439711 [Chytridium lagenaria]